MTDDMAEIQPVPHEDPSESSISDESKVVPREVLSKAIKRRDFEPEAPKEVQQSITSADRSSVDSLNREIERFDTQPSSGNFYQEQEPVNVSVPVERTHSRRGFLKLLGVTGVAVAGGGVLYSLLNRGEGKKSDESDNLPVVVPTVEPKTDATPTIEPTKEPAKAEKSPYEFGFSEKVGNVTVQITKQTQERTECPDPESAIKSAKMVPCNPTHEIVVNKDVFPDAEERIEEVFKKGIYYAWQRADQSRAGVTYEEYLQRVDKGEDMSIKARGFQGSSFLPTEINISPTDEFFYDTIHEPISIVRPWTSLGVGYREVVNKDGKKEFHLEIFDFTAGGVGSSFPEVAQYSAGNLMAVGLSYLGFPDIQKSGTFITPAQNEASGAVVVPLRNIVFQRVNNTPYSILGAK